MIPVLEWYTLLVSVEFIEEEGEARAYELAYNLSRPEADVAVTGWGPDAPGQDARRSLRGFLIAPLPEA